MYFKIFQKCHGNLRRLLVQRVTTPMATPVRIIVSEIHCMVSLVFSKKLHLQEIAFHTLIRDDSVNKIFIFILIGKGES